MLTVILLLSFFMLSMDVGFSMFQAQKTQTDVMDGFKPVIAGWVNYYDNVAVLKKLHFLYFDKGQVNVFCCITPFIV